MLEKVITLTHGSFKWSAQCQRHDSHMPPLRRFCLAPRACLPKPSTLLQERLLERGKGHMGRQAVETEVRERYAYIALNRVYSKYGRCLNLLGWGGGPRGGGGRLGTPKSSSSARSPLKPMHPIMPAGCQAQRRNREEQG